MSARQAVVVRRYTQRDRESVYVCVCVCEGERERERDKKRKNAREEEREQRKPNSLRVGCLSCKSFNDFATTITIPLCRFEVTNYHRRGNCNRPACLYFLRLKDTVN